MLKAGLGSNCRNRNPEFTRADSVYLRNIDHPSPSPPSLSLWICTVWVGILEESVQRGRQTRGYPPRIIPSIGLRSGGGEAGETSETSSLPPLLSLSISRGANWVKFGESPGNTRLEFAVMRNLKLRDERNLRAHLSRKRITRKWEEKKRREIFVAKIEKKIDWI